MLREERVEGLFGFMFSWSSGYVLLLKGADTNYTHNISYISNGTYYNIHALCGTICVEDSGLAELRYCTSRLC